MVSAAKDRQDALIVLAVAAVDDERDLALLEVSADAVEDPTHVAQHRELVSLLEQARLALAEGHRAAA